MCAATLSRLLERGISDGDLCVVTELLGRNDDPSAAHRVSEAKFSRVLEMEISGNINFRYVPCRNLLVSKLGCNSSECVVT